MNKYRINKLDIEGFRIYSRKQSINIYKNLTVVYGRNGRGKTTLQDAIGWLFNNNIARYIPYKGEWNRAKKTHIRSLINPDVETQITGYFEDISNNKIHKITRNETGILDSNTLIDSLFDNPNKKDDLLWANSLSQSKLQELAVANGRDRLENLAPLLDLTEVNNKVKEIDDELKYNRAQLLELEGKRKLISEKDQSDLLENFRKKAEELRFTLNTLITLPSIPDNNISVFSEVEKWRIWLKKVLDKVIEKQGIINNFINQNSNDNLIFSFSEYEQDFTKSVEELDKELKLTVKKETVRKNNIEKLGNNLKIIEQEIQTIITHFEDLHIKMNNKNKSAQIIKQLELKIQNHLKLSSKLDVYKMKMKEILEQKNEVNISLDKINNDRNEIEKTYSKLINNNENIKIHINKINEIEKWLSDNSNSYNNQKILNKLESELESFDDKFSDIYEEQKRIENSFDILSNNISDEHCPFCGKNHHSKQDLILSIKNQKKRSLQTLFELNNDFIMIKNRIKEINDLSILKENREKQLRESERIIKEINLENEQMKTMLQPIIDFYKLEAKAENLDEKLLLNLLRSNELSEIETNKEITELESNYIKRQKEFNDLNELIKSERELYDNTVEQMNSIQTQIEKKKQNILEKVTYYGYEGNLEKNALINFFNNLQNNIKSQVQDLESTNYSLDIKNIRYELYNNYIQQQDILSEVLITYKELEELLSAIEESINLLSFNSSLIQDIKNIEITIENLNVRKKEQREVQRLETNKEIGKMASRISAIFEVLSDTSPWKTIMSDAVVPGARERTNLIFRPIPHKFKNDLGSYIENTDSNSTFAFSGGQLSLLGLSIFLSQVADEHSNSNDNNKAILDTIILDDPIQMLDTLRDDALISLICDIAQDKQVIISTSDIDFANKLILASRPLWEFDKKSCGILHFDNLEEDGPVINEYSPGKWITDQRIYLPKINIAK